MFSADCCKGCPVLYVAILVRNKFVFSCDLNKKAWKFSSNSFLAPICNMTKCLEKSDDFTAHSLLFSLSAGTLMWSTFRVLHFQYVCETGTSSCEWCTVNKSSIQIEHWGSNGGKQKEYFHALYNFLYEIHWWNRSQKAEAQSAKIANGLLYAAAITCTPTKSHGTQMKPRNSCTTISHGEQDMFASKTYMPRCRKCFPAKRPRESQNVPWLTYAIVTRLSSSSH